jgi:hypothetical protein
MVNGPSRVQVSKLPLILLSDFGRCECRIHCVGRSGEIARNGPLLSHAWVLPGFECFGDDPSLTEARKIWVCRKSLSWREAARVSRASVFLKKGKAPFAERRISEKLWGGLAETTAGRDGRIPGTDRRESSAAPEVFGLPSLASKGAGTESGGARIKVGAKCLHFSHRERSSAASRLGFGIDRFSREARNQ